MLILLSVTSQAEPLRERFIVELQQNSIFPNQIFSIKPVLSALACNPPDIADKGGYAGSYSLPDEKPRRPEHYGVKTPLIESIVWQLFYATQMLVGGYELILTTKVGYLFSKPYSWLPPEVVVAVCWLVKSYWNPSSPSFNPIAQQEANSTLKQGFITITMVPGSEHNQPHPLSESSDGHTSGATNQLTGTFTSPLYSTFGGGNRGPQQLLHTLGLNCFVHPCRGVCIFRSSTYSRVPDEWPYNSAENSTVHTGTTPGQSSHPHMANGLCVHCTGHFDAENARFSIIAGAVYATDPAGPVNDDVTMPQNLLVTSDDWIIINGLLKLHDHTHPGETGIFCSPSHDQQALSNHKRRDRTGQQTCDETVVGKYGQQRPCGTVCKNTQTLSFHKIREHSGQKTCDETVVGAYSQLRPCGKLYRNAKALSEHKRKIHSGQKVCYITVIAEDGQPRQCSAVCKNAKGLTDHKRKVHSGQQTCNVTVIGEDGQQRPCGTVCESALDLSAHKSREHSGQQICYMTVVGEDSQLRPCGTVCKNAQVLSSHKSREHSGQKTCEETVVREDGQLRPCGKVFKNARARSDHKRTDHTGQQICDVAVVGEGGRLRPCGKTYKNVRTLTDHKRNHRKRKHFDVNQDDVPCLKKVN